MKRETIWAYLDGKKLVDVLQAALDNHMTISETKKLLIKQENEKLIKFGIILNDRFGFGRDTKYFVCSVCGKQDYEF